MTAEKNMESVENRDIAIKLSGVRKKYKLGQIGGGTLTADLQSWWARFRGKEDPNVKIGQDQRLIGQTFYALNGIDLTVYKGEALGIIGGNGAGKSTMLKLLSRVTAPTEGEIDIYGRITSMLEVGTGFNGELTGRENVYMNGAILGMTKAEIDAKMEEIIEFSEVREFIDTPVKRYSSGMYVKLAFSVAAHLDSEIMIMDEVLAVGDMAFQKKCLDKMRDAAKKEGRTVLYVSHNMNTIRQLCDRCVVLDKGKVIFKGGVEEGIGVYLGSTVNVLKNFSFYEDDHEKWCSQKIFVEKATFLNTDVFSIYTGETLNLQVEIRAKCDLNALKARIVIMDEYGSIIGMTMSENSFEVKKGHNVLNFNLSSANMAAGKYTTRISFFALNEFGGHDYLGVINHFVAFELQDKPDIHHGILWSRNSWGSVAFQDFTVEVSI